MSYDLLIRGGTVVTAADVARADVGICDGRIVAIADRLQGGDASLDAGRRLVMPGGIDAHVHLDQPQAPGAALAGATSIVPFCVQHRGQSLVAAVADYHRRADGRSLVDHAYHLNVTSYEGFDARGWPVTAPSRGEVVVEDGVLKGAPGRGRFLEQATSSAWRPRQGEHPWT